jgi:UDP-glucose 4-epimerase
MMRPLGAGTAALVTGGAGFIGSHLVERLVSLGASVTVLDDLSTGSRENLGRVADRIELLPLELGEALGAGALLPSRFDFVFHLAANPYIPTSVDDPALDYRSNLAASFALLEALRPLPRRPVLVIASSAAVYGDPSRLPIREQDPTVPISPYGVSKLAAERYLAVYASLYGLPALSLRLFSVYGPRQKKQVVYDLMGRLRDDPSVLDVIGDGSQERDLSFVTDVAEAFLAAATRAPARGESLNVASGESLTIADLVSAICRAWEVAPSVRYTGRTRPGDAERWRVDVSALAALGHSPRVALDEGLRAVRDWMRHA